jgi:hypothetical protein
LASFSLSSSIIKSSSSSLYIIDEGASVNLKGARAVDVFFGTMGGLELIILGGITPFKSSSSSLDDVSSISGLHSGSNLREDQFLLWKPRAFSNLVASFQLAAFL